jgi:hypothetical protein
MGLVGEKFLRSCSASVLSAKQSHSFSPRLRRDQGERNIERGQHAFEHASRTAETECRDNPLAWSGGDPLNGGCAFSGIRPERTRKGHGINLIDGPWPSLNFSSGHIDHDNRTVVRVENN